MFRIVALAGVVAIATAQNPQISGNNGSILISTPVGDVNVVRRQSVNVGELDNSVQAIATRLAAVESRVNLEQGSAEFVQQMLQATTSATQSFENRVTTVEERLGATTSSMANLLTSMSDLMDRVNAAQEATAINVASQMAEMAENSTLALDAALDNVTRSLGAQAAQVNGQLANMTAALASKSDDHKNRWVGGCAAAVHGCWTDVCHDRVTYDTARPKFFKRTDTRMRAMVGGWFRANAYTLNNSCGYAHISFMLAGQRVTHTHMHTYHAWWKDQSVDVTHRINPGQDFWIQICAHCNHHIHGFSVHQRLEYEYVGI